MSDRPSHRHTLGIVISSISIHCRWLGKFISFFFSSGLHVLGFEVLVLFLSFSIPPLRASFPFFETTAARAEMRYFWQQKDWRIADIEDPEDWDCVRYAILAVLLRLMCKDFNGWMEKGFPRGAFVSSTADISPPEVEEEEEGEGAAGSKTEEEMPLWVDQVARVREKGGNWVRLPGVHGLPDEHDSGLSAEFWAMGILIEEPNLQIG